MKTCLWGHYNGLLSFPRVEDPSVKDPAVILRKWLDLLCSCERRSTASETWNEKTTAKLWAGSQEADSTYTCVSLSYVINTRRSGPRPWVDNPKALREPDIAPTLHGLDKLGFHTVACGSGQLLRTWRNSWVYTSLKQCPPTPHTHTHTHTQMHASRRTRRPAHYPLG
jgi:hypothetical protein